MQSGNYSPICHCGFISTIRATQAAVQAGATTLDSSFGGTGGCPFAPNATGNISTEDLLYMLHRSGIETGMSLEHAIEAAEWIEQELGKTVPGMVMKAGIFPA